MFNKISTTIVCLVLSVSRVLADDNRIYGLFVQDVISHEWYLKDEIQGVQRCIEAGKYYVSTDTSISNYTCKLKKEQY